MSKKMITFCDVNGLEHDFPIESVDYGTCSTSIMTSQKDVVCEGFSLYAGALIVVKFSTRNDTSPITMNVNNTGAKTVYFPDSDGGMSTESENYIQSGGCYLFAYDGTYWRFCGSPNVLHNDLRLYLNGSLKTFNGSQDQSLYWYAPSDEGSTGQVVRWDDDYSEAVWGDINEVFYGIWDGIPSDVEKDVVCDGFSLYTGAKIVVWFEWAHEAATMTMNVNNTGAKQVIFPGVSSSSTAATGQIGQKSAYLFVYNGTYWVLCGSSPVSCDNQTLELVNGKLALKGFSNATSGQMPRVNEDGTGIEWYMPISERTVIPNVPSQSGTLTYTGSSKTPSWSNYDSSKMTLSVTPQVNAGTYTATFTPKDAYRWADGTIESKTVNWTINKAAGSITLNKTSITLNKNTKTATFTVTRAGNGKISVSSNKTSVATVSPTSSTSTGTVTFTVTGVNNAVGDATITVSVAAGTNHNAASNKTISVSVEMISANLEDNEPAAIKAAAQSGQAKNLWSVGDKAPIAISGTVGSLSISGTYYAVIIGFDHNSSIEGNNSIHFQIGQNSSGKNIAFVDSNYGNRDTTNGFCMRADDDINTGGWKDSYMRSTICPAFLNALPTAWRNIIASCTKYSNNGTESNVVMTSSTQDKIWLLSSYEVFANDLGYYDDEAIDNQEQYDYYKNGNSKVRYKHNSTSMACNWWLRGRTDMSMRFYCVRDTGINYLMYATCSYGFSPGFKVA